ncbi:hypothetical protein BDP81DRAFT_452037 [Colletotrichum phormii]|uniref:Uncharacterized protein n=1 Tax=Colletotrichum phormii TaxID=359342 RepID=A0AAJ0EEI2_9PEZI|nr:uncharacterized protein BDP81DRAFT_452037 [Colletotrichum phormii]KAK1634121.1 hypothetical protein BDP81DRAFT_452037 [Colletotrichum phormii]
MAIPSSRLDCACLHRTASRRLLPGILLDCCLGFPSLSTASTSSTTIVTPNCRAIDKRATDILYTSQTISRNNIETPHQHPHAIFAGPVRGRYLAQLWTRLQISFMIKANVRFSLSRIILWRIHRPVKMNRNAQDAVLDRPPQEPVPKVRQSQDLDSPREHQQNIDTLEEVASGRRQMYVSEIWLDLELEEYAYAKYYVEEDTAERSYNNEIFDIHMKSLLRTLSGWQLSYGDEEHSGIHLRFSAMSPNDTTHQFWPWDNGPCPNERYLSLGPAALLGARKRTIGNLLDFQNGNSASSLTSLTETEFPVISRVPIVKKFSVRDIRYRSLTGDAIRFLLMSLNNLEAVDYTPWLGIDEIEKSRRCSTKVALLESLPPTVKRVKLWETRHDKFHGSIDEPGPIRHVARAAALACSRLVSFSSRSVLNAAHFFDEVIQLHAVDDGTSRPVKVSRSGGPHVFHPLSNA